VQEDLQVCIGSHLWQVLEECSIELGGKWISGACQVEHAGVIDGLAGEHYIMNFGNLIFFHEVLGVGSSATWAGEVAGLIIV
jgi:hypothetical protein